MSWYGKSQNILLRIPLKLFWSKKKQLKSCFFFCCSECNHDQVIRCTGKLFFPLFSPTLLKENQKYEQKLWPKNQDVNPYSQEMCAGTNKNVIVWDNQPHMCTGFFTPSRSTWPLDVKSTPHACLWLWVIKEMWLVAVAAQSPQLLWHLDNMNQLSK